MITLVLVFFVISDGFLKLDSGKVKVKIYMINYSDHDEDPIKNNYIMATGSREIERGRLGIIIRTGQKYRLVSSSLLDRSNRER